ncbi:MAG: hypothetical protein AB8B58_05035 [Roseobacter sp.]
MLIFLDARFAYLATPKTGTTATEAALRPRADIAFQAGRKHMPARRFVTKVAPFVSDAFGVNLATVAVMRAPVDQLRSWYRYRARDARAGDPRSTQGVSFADFIEATLADDPPDYARVGSQFRFFARRGDIVVDHIFAYETPDPFQAFLSERLKTPVRFAKRNVSPDLDADLPPQTEAKLREARAAEFALYDRVVAAGGHLSKASASASGP